MKRACLIVALAALAMGSLPTGATAQVSEDNVTDLPVLARRVERGASETTSVTGSPATPKVIDGAIEDWVGDITRYGGTYVYSNGELVYQDHLFDAHGADDGRDARRMELLGPLEEAVPETYRIDALMQEDPPSQVGADSPEPIAANDTIGDATSHQSSSDIEEVRIAVADEALYLLVRTTTMTATNQPGVLLLTDNGGAEAEHEVPFDAGLTTSTADHAVFLAGASGTATDLATGTSTALSPGDVAVQPDNFTNAIEARIPLSTIGGSLPLRVAVATGPASTDGMSFAHLTLETNDAVPHPNVANVAFRTEEPVQTWFEREQALTLHGGSIDPFFVDLDSDKLASGIAETFHPGPGYHDRIFVSDSTPQVVREGNRNGAFQHYGLYLPSAYDATPEDEPQALPLQWWLHWRGGKAHTAGSVIPRMFKHYGEEQDTIVVSPSARGTGTWYVWEGHVDFLEVWDDVFATFPIDESRVYASGHSMGGWGSYLMTLLYPDRFAAAAPVAGPVTQGLWTGLDFPECDRFAAGDSTPCYVSEDGGRGRDQHTRKLLENTRHVPYAILQGTNDELVWYTGVSQQSTRLIELGYRHRLYTYPGYEHFSHPAVDQWSEAAEYLHSFTNPINPSQVTFMRSMPFERATEEVQAPSPAHYLQLDADSAYWMSGLTPVDMQAGIASFDGRSLAIPEEPTLAIPDGSGPAASGTTGPFIATGLAWIDDPRSGPPAAENGFDVELEDAKAVTLDLERMEIAIDQPISGQVSTDEPLDLTLRASWGATPDITIDDTPTTVQRDADAVTVTVPARDHALSITPSQEPTESPSGTPTESPSATPTGPEVTSLEFVDTASIGQYSDEARFTARLTDAQGDPLAGESVTFTLETAEGPTSAAATTDENGTANAALVLEQRPGSGNLTVRFDPTDDHLGSSDQMGFDVTKEDSVLSLDIQGKGSKMSLVATLTDLDSGAGVSERTISFAADDNEICDSAPTTSQSGRTACDPPPRYQGGHHDYSATFVEDDYFLGSSADRST